MRKVPTFTRVIGQVRVENNRIVFLSGQDVSDSLTVFPGLGSGVYDVTGTFSHVPGHGPRLVGLSMEFLSQQELLWMEDELYSPVHA